MFTLWRTTSKVLIFGPFTASAIRATNRAACSKPFDFIHQLFYLVVLPVLIVDAGPALRVWVFFFPYATDVGIVVHGSASLTNDWCWLHYELRCFWFMLAGYEQ